jgi:hypothetical protein
MKQIFLLSIISILSFIPCLAQESNSLFPIIVKGKWGFINQKGEITIEPQFDGAGKFKDGLAVASKGKMVGYINGNGRFVIQTPPEINLFGMFSEGFVPISQNNKYGYINKKGEVVILPQYIYAGNFLNGIARIRMKDGFGFINESGTLVDKAV